LIGRVSSGFEAVPAFLRFMEAAEAADGAPRGVIDPGGSLPEVSVQLGRPPHPERVEGPIGFGSGEEGGSNRNQAPFSFRH
jgi:hypothetical protein